MTTPRHIHLQAHGVSLVLEHDGERLPSVLHWGRALGQPSPEDLDALSAALSRQTPPGTLDAAWQVSLSPQEGDGFAGRPGLEIRRRGVLHHPRWRVRDAAAAATACTVVADDQTSGLVLTIEVTIEAGGVVWVSQALELPAAAEPVEVGWLEATLPVPAGVDALLTFDGRWTREKRPVALDLPPGSNVRQSRRGRPGHDAPLVGIVSRGAARWDSGEVWGVHPAWSSDVTVRTDRLTDAVPLIGAGELLRPGEVVLSAGERYDAPRVAFVYSDEGLDGFAGRVHAWMRARPQHPQTPRPLVLNTWEAVYFDQDPERLAALAERAAEIGVERFVLDDGWFQGRRDDSTSLGDWVVDRRVWPDGLAPLADRVHALGMQFGLWFEPEMVSLNSDLARSHPDWLLHEPGHLDHPAALSWRQQYVLDLAHPEAFAHVLERIDDLVVGLGIDFIKWDHNRDLVESVHAGRPGGHVQMLAVYELIRELKARHPALEIESCSSGGARTDLGMLEVCDRVWASDSNDPIERQDIQRWTGLLLPPELVGAHVGPTDAHSSGRRTSLSYRMATSLMGSAGFEWDILACDAEETAALSRFAALYRELRPIVHSGTVRHPLVRDPAWRATAFTTDHAAVVIVATVASLEDARAERLRIPGLSPELRYRVRVRREIGDAAYGWVAPEWFTTGEITLAGSLLSDVGLQLPTLWPAQAFVLHLEAI
ncbi:alpha-galactosidase [Microbacterium sp. zg.Y909]|uniref:alpha-galactosidase n=1 Tax=Microbacterium sp. zg.Y909 TaxID=2969413 RepID=UPI00214CFD2A|nr:alpha-galactosidase [Microbacterium sp. zg.Y909]MCR2825849.1 alpha-galactosidase [Microbacterium sp. zg.Y909]